MKIIYLGNALTDGGDGSPLGFAVGGSKQVDTALPIRASHGVVFDRGNKRITLEWQHIRRFETVPDAQIFAARHGDALPAGEDTAYLTLSGGTSVQLTGAVLEAAECIRYEGTLTEHRYRLTGRTVTGGALPTWSGGTGIQFGGSVLSGGGVNGFVAFTVGGQRVVDLGEFLRAATARPIDRRNRLNTIRWQQQRDFATADAAEQFLLLHGQAVPDGTADLTLTNDAGSTVTLEDAVVQVPQGRRIAATRTVHSYQATGRALTGAPVPGWIDPNDGSTVVDPNLVYHLGEVGTWDDEDVTHTP